MPLSAEVAESILEQHHYKDTKFCWWKLRLMTTSRAPRHPTPKPNELFVWNLFPAFGVYGTPTARKRLRTYNLLGFSLQSYVINQLFQCQKASTLSLNPNSPACSIHLKPTSSQRNETDLARQDTLQSSACLVLDARSAALPSLLGCYPRNPTQ